MNLRVFVALLGAAAAVWAFRRWRMAAQAVMVLLIFEGAIRKWVFHGAQDLIYFAKDVLLLGVYAGYFRDRHRLRLRMPPPPVISGALVFAALFGVLEVFNPSLPNLLVGIFGFKAYFFYVPLIFVLPAAFPNDAALYRFLRRYVLIAIPVGLLAVAQFFSPASSALNTYARTGEDAYAITFGSSSYVRVTSTFSFITGYTAYLVATSILLLALLGALRWRFRGHLPLFVSLGMTLLGMLMTGSRAPVVIFLLILPFYWWLAVMKERGGGATFGRLVLALTLVGAALTATNPEAIAAFRGRAAGVGDVSSRFSSPLMAPYVILPEAGLLGYGIGSTHQSAPTLAPNLAPYSWLNGLLVEVETGRIMLELGPIGFFLIYFIRLFWPIYAFRQLRRLHTRFHRALATGSFLFFLAAVPSGVVFDVTSNLYFWFFGGLLMTVIRLDRLAAIKAARLAAAPQATTDEALSEAAPAAAR